MRALSVRLVPAAVAVSRRGKRTDWACASVLYGAVDFFGGECEVSDFFRQWCGE